MADYNSATVDSKTFQENTPSGRGWRKRYVKENGGEWTRGDDTWTWSGGAVSKPKPSYVTPVAEKPVVSRKFD